MLYLLSTTIYSRSKSIKQLLQGRGGRKECYGAKLMASLTMLPIILLDLALVIYFRRLASQRVVSYGVNILKILLALSSHEISSVNPHRPSWHILQDQAPL